MMTMNRRVPQFMLAVAAVLTLGACRQDMYNQPKLKPLAPTKFFNDATSARPLPAHVVARGELDEDPILFRGREADGTFAATLPVPVTRQLLERGRERYNVFCSVCHAADGAGRGMIVQRGFPPPPTFHLDRLRDAPPGYLFDVITNGYGVMYPYGYRLPDVQDRWAVVAYLRALQLAHDGRPGDVPPAERARLEAAQTGKP